jgi:DNA repair protein SbcC/Rad50
MRIQKIRLKNLNSLAGVWEIDLTSGAYVADGIFAITGPTGSGKTTILDAICLALYGCTPRLKTISKSTNEIMHRRAGECSAEVEIATAGGIYRCTWAQERARGKPDGTLQTPHHEIADVLTEEVLTTRKREVPKLVEKLTGMDYDRFTRSVMLAQGDFATFLNASPDERSPLLEQITGTEIYSRISVAVHQRKRKEDETLKVLEAEGSGIALLPDEEITALREEEATLTEKADALQEEIKQCRTGIAWHQDMTRIDSAIAETEHEEADWTEERAAAEEGLSRLQRGETAAAQEGAYRQITTLRESREKNRTSLGQLEAAMPDKMDAIRRTEETVSLQKKSLTKVKERADLAAPAIREVRELDRKLQAGADRLSEVTEAQERADADWESACTDLHRGTDTKVRSPEETEATAWFLTDRGISGDPASFISDSMNLTKQLTAAVPGDAARPIPAEIDAWCTTANTEIGSLQQSLTEILWYQDPAALRVEINTSQEQRTQLTLLRDRISESKDDARKSRDFTTRLNEKREEYARYEQALERCIYDRERQVRLTKQMEENALLAARIHDLETERSHLRAGDPCPLCGSTIHPYADETAALPRATDEELKREQGTLSKIQKKEATLCQAMIQCKSEAEAADEALAIIRERAAHREEAWADGCRACGLTPDTPESEAVVHTALEEANETIKRYYTTETAIWTLKEEVRTTETLIANCRQAVLRFGDAQRCAVRTAEIQAEMVRIQEKRENLLSDISPDEAEAQFTGMIRAEEEKLEAAQNDYQKTVQEIAGLEGEVRVLRDSIKRQGEELKEAERLFDEAVCSAGFLGEGDFAVALLAPEEAADLRKERDRLKQWQAGIAAQRASALKEAETHRSLAGTVNTGRNGENPGETGEPAVRYKPG